MNYLTGSIVIFYFLLFCFGCKITKNPTAAQTEKVINTSKFGFKYDKVTAYEFDGTGGRSISHVYQNLRTLIKNQKTISKRILDELEGMISDSANYGQGTSSCFDPHLGLIYSLKSNEVASISICLDCNFLDASFEIPACKAKYEVFGTNYKYYNGFSKEMRIYLDGVKKSLGFLRYKNSLDSIYDQ